MISRNMARCKKCLDVIESKSAHDLVRCKCGTIFVNGGHRYLLAGGDLNFFEDLSVYSHAEVVEEEGGETNDNEGEG
jgi:hypothetical protein